MISFGLVCFAIGVAVGTITTIFIMNKAIKNIREKYITPRKWQ